MERVLIDDYDSQCAIRLRWKKPPNTSDRIAQYSTYIRKADTGPGMIQYGLQNDFSTERTCGGDPKPNDLVDGVYEWCIILMEKLK